LQYSGVGEGSLYNYTNNVATVLLSPFEDQAWWPADAMERQKATEGFGMAGALGAIDGSLLVQDHHPKKLLLADHYNGQKKVHCVSLVKLSNLSRARADTTVSL
jgi:hypothetical protein